MPKVTQLVSDIFKARTHIHPVSLFTLAYMDAIVSQLDCKLMAKGSGVPHLKQCRHTSTELAFNEYLISL